MLGFKTNLNKFKAMEIIQTCGNETTHFKNNTRIKEEVSKEIKKYRDLTKNENKHNKTCAMHLKQC